MTDNQPFKRCALKCPNCKNTQYINRRMSRLKKYGHIKPLWCPICHKRTKHIEYDPYKEYFIELESDENE